MQTYAYGFPRLGKNREYKKLIEGYWEGKVSRDSLLGGIDALERNRLAIYEEHVDFFPAGEMTLYDNMLDTALMVGAYYPAGLDGYYELCRGKEALEMTKWFNTNYHYIVPELGRLAEARPFEAAWNKPAQELQKHKKGIPYFIGPFTFLKLSKGISQGKFEDLLLALGDVYGELFKGFKEAHLDEPAFVMELSADEIKMIGKVYEKLGRRCDINLFTYYDSVDFLEVLYDLPVKALGLDLVNGRDNLEQILDAGFPADKVLVAGLVNGKNIWKTDIREALRTVERLSAKTTKLMVSNASPLYHLPITVQGEKLDEALLSSLSFAEEKLFELELIARACDGDTGDISSWNKKITGLGFDSEVRERVGKLGNEDFVRKAPYAEREKEQQEKLKLPLFPTTTIGSFPQSSEVRKQRADFRAGRISSREYEHFVEGKIAEVVSFQEEVGLDVLVHGEFERTDMVEFFAQKLCGMATTSQGWIISYGTRVYRPPIVYGDVSRSAPMTVKEIAYAQSLTKKPMKGMLTGPVTIIAWSFVRDDIPVSEVAYQIALCLQDEIKDYEKAGIGIAQIDEPAFREKAPIKKHDWDEYFAWAIRAFRLSSQAQAGTQIHTHMCYSEFGEIIPWIAQMDFDVITIEASRSRGDILEHFEGVGFDRQIGLGVWDIHSPAVASVEDMRGIVRRALRLFPCEKFWLNPDCGLKTRKWEEVSSTLQNMVTLARELRRQG